MRKVLFDTNVILDIALKRYPYFEDALTLFSLIDREIISGNVTASTITDIYYISRKEKGHDGSIAFIKDLIEVVEIIGIDKDIVVKALTSAIKDFEDAIQVTASELNQVEIIVTRNKSDFINAPVKVVTPQEFLADFK